MIRFSYKKLLGGVLAKEEVIEPLVKKLKKVDTTVFRERLKKIYIWEKDGDKKANVVMQKILGTYALGDLGGSTTLGIFDSLVPECVEFWICSSQPEQCIKGRKCILKNIPYLLKKAIRITESDILLLEGDAKIPKEGKFSRYVRGDFNIGFLVSLIMTGINSIGTYFFTTDKVFDYRMPVLVLLAWLTVFGLEVVYNKGKGVYIVK